MGLKLRDAARAGLQLGLQLANLQQQGKRMDRVYVLVNARLLNATSVHAKRGSWQEGGQCRRSMGARFLRFQPPPLLANALM